MTVPDLFFIIKSSMLFCLDPTWNIYIKRDFNTSYTAPAPRVQ